MSTADYWKECIGIAADECGLVLTDEQLNCPHKRGAATALARELGVSITVVCGIRNGKRWAHLK